MRLPAEWSQLLASSATEYCYLIEHLDQVNGDWLDNLSSLLPRIHAAVSAIPEPQINACPCDVDLDLDLRFELYTRLRKLLGDHDGYVLDFDKPEELVVGLFLWASRAFFPTEDVIGGRKKTGRLPAALHPESEVEIDFVGRFVRVGNANIQVGLPIPVAIPHALPKPYIPF